MKTKWSRILALLPLFLCRVYCTAQTFVGGKDGFMVRFDSQTVVVNDSLLRLEPIVSCSTDSVGLTFGELQILNAVPDSNPMIFLHGKNVPHSGDVYMADCSILSDDIVAPDSRCIKNWRDRLYEVVYVYSVVNIKKPDLCRIAFDKRLLTYDMLDAKKKASVLNRLHGNSRPVERLCFSDTMQEANVQAPEVSRDGNIVSLDFAPVTIRWKDKSDTLDIICSYTDAVDTTSVILGCLGEHRSFVITFILIVMVLLLPL